MLRGEVVGFAVTERDTSQVPVPAAVFNVAHGTGLCAVHAQPAPVVIEIPVSELPPPTATDVGVTEYSQAPDCVTVNDLPAIERIPVRTLDPVCSATVNETVPGPVPPGPLATLIHATGEEAVHAQSAVVDTLTDRADAAAPNATLLLDRAVVQTLPACETVNARVPIVRVPTRVADEGFGAAV